jgi:gamma-glutamyltranspeptidase / glutathione hydrolase / leukotriene-C4 hydrolase
MSVHPLSIQIIHQPENAVTISVSFAARTQVGDPAFNLTIPKIVNDIVSKSYALETFSRINDDKTHDVSYYNPNFYSSIEDHGTTHVSVVDKEGMAVGITSTINLVFGSKVTDRDTGVLFNDEMVSF